MIHPQCMRGQESKMAPPEPLIVEQSAASSGALVLRLAGRLDHQTADALRGALDGALASEPRLLVLDMSGLAFMASAGFRALLYARRRTQEAGCALTLASFAPPVQDVFTVSRFAELFDVRPDVQAALDAGAA
jgi:stage II sporulation protein AA (anti-sigma F factor antagonist)